MFKHLFTQRCAAKSSLFSKCAFFQLKLVTLQSIRPSKNQEYSYELYNITDYRKIVSLMFEANNISSSLLKIDPINSTQKIFEPNLFMKISYQIIHFFRFENITLLGSLLEQINYPVKQHYCMSPTDNSNSLTDFYKFKSSYLT